MKIVLLKFVIRCLPFSKAIPLSLVRQLGRSLGALFAHIPSRDVKRCREHLARAFPDKTPQWIHKTSVKCWRHFFQAALTDLRLLHVKNTHLYKGVKVEGLEHMYAHRAAHKRGEGTVIMGGHFGNWEMQLRFMDLAGDMYSVGKKLVNPVINDLVVNNIRIKGTKVKVIYQEQGLIPCAKALRKGGSVTMIPDQDLPQFQGLFSTWFGIPAWTPLGPASLARTKKVAIQPCYCYEKAGYFILHWGPRKLFPRTDNQEHDVQIMTDWILAYEEALVRKHPEQWVWWHKRWRTTPEQIASRNEEN